MKINVYKNYFEFSSAIAFEMIAVIRVNPEAAFCLATGDTPKLAYEFFVKEIQKQSINISKCFFFGLDEWLGVSPANSGSCHYFLHERVFSPLKIAESQIHLFDALAKDESAECIKMNNIIEDKGGIDCMLVGVGMNGHIGFNEPGCDTNNKAHIVPLDSVTLSVGQKYFAEKTIIKKGITLGLRQVMEAKTLLMGANGSGKASIVKKVLKEEVGNAVPASYVRNHRNSFVFLDEESTAAINDKTYQ